jgi:hypothetical protein
MPVPRVKTACKVKNPNELPLNFQGNRPMREIFTHHA